MMVLRAVPLHATLAALLVLGCPAPRVSSADAQEQAGMVRLVDRLVLLQRRIESTGKATPDDRAELTLLLDDIRAWQKRTGRTDLGIKDPAAGTVARDGVIDINCDCPFVKSYPLELCFLIGTGDCTAGEDSSCAYVCVTMPGEVVGMWRPPAGG